MKTQHPDNIRTVDEAKQWLKELHSNGELYNPDDDTHDIIWNLPQEQLPTHQECNHMNMLMGQVWELKGFDPHEYCLEQIM